MYKPFNPFRIVEIFEEQIASYAGSKFAIATDTGTSALELCCSYLRVKEVWIPNKTYISVPQAIIRSGGTVKFKNYSWTGQYYLSPYPIIDSALRFTSNMHYPNTFRCLSFHYKKHLDIGRGGMILFDDEKALKFFKQKRYHGRNDIDVSEDNITMIGNSYNMEPSRAADGLHRMLYMPLNNEDINQEYPDISEHPIWSMDTLSSPEF